MIESKLEKDMKQIEESMSHFEKDYLNTHLTTKLNNEDTKKLSFIYNGIHALYLQNKILIEQNQEIIKYLENKK